MIEQDDNGIWYRIHCPNCGSTDMRGVAGMIAECNKCSISHLHREYPQWKSPLDEIIKLKFIPVE